MTRDKLERLQNLREGGLLAELKRIELKTRRKVSTDLMGNYRSAFRGSGIVFSDIREYQPGDEVKNIHWRCTARTGKVYVKSYEEERQLNVLLAVDISASTDLGRSKTKHIKALEFAALVAILAEKSQDNIGLCLFSDRIESYIPPGKAKGQLQRVLFELLEHRELRQGTDIKQALEYVNLHQRRASVVFLISDFFSPPFESILKVIAAKHDVICVALQDPLDRELPRAGLVEFKDAESGQRITIDTSSRRARSALSARFEKHISDTQAVCKRAAADFIIIDDSPMRPLADLMRKRQARVR